MVLLVEDNEVFRQLAGAALQSRLEGGVVLEASCLAEARAHVTAQRIDVLVTDVVLPDGSGFELIESVRTTQEPYVIVYSNYTAEELRAGLSEHRIDKYVSKEAGLRGLTQAVLDGLASRP